MLNIGDIMFNEQSEDCIRVGADFLNKDKETGQNLNRNLHQYGKVGVQQMSYEIFTRLQKKFGPLEKISVKEIAKLVECNYGFGVERFVDEYERGIINQEDIMNVETILDDRSINNARARVAQVNSQIEGLCEANRVDKVNPCFGDFTGRSFKDVVNLIEKRYGTDFTKKVVYYEQIVREPLEEGLYDTLRRTKSASLEDVAELTHHCGKIENLVQGIAHEQQQTNRSALESLFK